MPEGKPRDCGELGEELCEQNEEDDWLEEGEEQKNRVAQDLLQGPDEKVVGVGDEAHSLTGLLLAPNLENDVCLVLSSSTLILLPVCWRKTSSRVGDAKLTDDRWIPFESNALTMSAMMRLAFFA